MLKDLFNQFMKNKYNSIYFLYKISRKRFSPIEAQTFINDYLTLLVLTIFCDIFFQ